MHQRLDQLWRHLHVVDLIIVGRVERRWGQKWRDTLHRGIVGSTGRLIVLLIPALDRPLFISVRGVFDRALRLNAAEVETILIALIVHTERNFNVFKTIAATFLVLAEELSELAAAVRAEAVEVTAIGQCKRVGLTARDGNDFLIDKCLDFGREWLVWLLVRILKILGRIAKTKLTVCCFAPGVD